MTDHVTAERYFQALDDLRREYGNAERAAVSLAAQLEARTKTLDEYRQKAHALAEAILGPGARLSWYEEALSEASSIRAQLEAAQGVIEALWVCPDGHLTNRPQPIPGRGDELGICPYPCNKPVARYDAARGEP